MEASGLLAEQVADKPYAPTAASDWPDKLVMDLHADPRLEISEWAERTGTLGSAEGSYVAIKPRVVTDFIVPILLGGVIAGTLDIGAASLINRTKPSRILQVIASGLLGRSALADDSTIELGFGLQWLMSIFIALVFVFATRWVTALQRHWVIAGLAYGLVIFLL